MNETHEGGEGRLNSRTPHASKEPSSRRLELGTMHHNMFHRVLNTSTMQAVRGINIPKDTKTTLTRIEKLQPTRHGR